MPALLTLEEAKSVLRLQDAEDDDFLTQLIEGVTSVIEHQVGWVSQRAETLEIRQGGCEAVLPGSNVISLTSGAYVRSGEAIDVSHMYVSSAGILCTDDGSLLPLEPWRLTLVVGMAPIPNGIKNAANEVLKEMYGIRLGGDTDAHSRPFLLSYRTMAHLEPFIKADGFA